MCTPTLILELPEDFVRDAVDFGLSNPTEILTVMRNELDRRIADFVEVEIQAYRAEKRAKEAVHPSGAGYAIISGTKEWCDGGRQ